MRRLPVMGLRIPAATVEEAERWWSSMIFKENPRLWSSQARMEPAIPCPTMM